MEVSAAESAKLSPIDSFANRVGVADDFSKEKRPSAQETV